MYHNDSWLRWSHVIYYAIWLINYTISKHFLISFHKRIKINGIDKSFYSTLAGSLAKVRKIFFSSYCISFREEDNDDIVNLLAKNCPALQELYGDYYVSEIIGRHPEMNRKILVAEVRFMFGKWYCHNNSSCLENYTLHSGLLSNRILFSTKTRRLEWCASICKLITKCYKRLTNWARTMDWEKRLL